MEDQENLWNHKTDPIANIDPDFTDEQIISFLEGNSSQISYAIEIKQDPLISIRIELLKFIERYLIEANDFAISICDQDLAILYYIKNVNAWKVVATTSKDDGRYYELAWSKLSAGEQTSFRVISFGLPFYTV